MKTCTKCKKGERLSWHSHCRECYRELDRRRYYANREKRLEKDKEYYQKNKHKWIIGFRKYRKKYPEKVKARQDLRNAIAQCKIKRGKCEKCGEPKTHAHHKDYSKPFDVVWLCVKHHYEQHRTKQLAR